MLFANWLSHLRELIGIDHGDAQAHDRVWPAK